MTMLFLKLLTVFLLLCCSVTLRPVVSAAAASAEHAADTEALLISEAKPLWSFYSNETKWCCDP